MKISCFLIVTTARMEKLKQTISKNKEIEIIAVEHDLTRFLGRVLPVTFKPDLIIMDFMLYKEFHWYLEPLRNNCRKLAILGDKIEEENSHALEQNYKKRFYFIQGPNFKNDLINCIAQISEDLIEESKIGHFYFENSWGSATLTFGEEISLDFANLLFIRYTPYLTLFHLSTITYISRFQLKNFKYLLRKKSMLKVSKTMVLNLDKIHKVDLRDSKITMVNGVSIAIQDAYWERFVVSIKKYARLSPEKNAIIDKYILGR